MADTAAPLIGIMKSSLPGFEKLDPVAVLEAIVRLGLGGVIFASITDLSETLDGGALAEFRHEAAKMGIAVGLGLPMINPSRPERNAAFASLGDDLPSAFRKILAAATILGVADLFFVIGTIDDREDRCLAWTDQIASVAALVKDLAPMLRNAGIRLLLKTHEEITTPEIARLVETAGADVLGVALDPVNVVCRIEDPVEATRRVAPFVRQIHVDDMVVDFEGNGLRRFLVPLGQGAIDWDAILALVPATAPRWIELHRGQFAMPVFDRAWLVAQPDVELEEYAAVIGMAARRVGATMPWNQADPLSRLDDALRWAKTQRG